MVTHEWWIKLAGLATAVLVHVAFGYGLVAGQPSPAAYAERYAHAGQPAARQATDDLRCAVT
ncbi:MAG: hypothetical protein P4L83_22265 [Nevskia sp.]|nr:hypothetical protein [Nevskia sp.]